MAEKIEFNIKVTDDQLGTALDVNTAKAKKTTSAIEQLKDAFKDAGREVSSIRASFLGNLGANVVTSAFNGLSASIGFTINQAREFSRSIAEVNSILPKNTKLTKDQTEAFIQLSSAYGKTAQSEAKAFYEIVSGGVEDTATAFKILRQANEASIAGLADVNVAAKVLTSTFNAFAQQGTSVNEITDALFQAVKDGQTTFNELSTTLGRISPIAASVGVNINEVAGSIAFLTKSGIQTDQAITGLRATISSIIKPSKEAADEANRLGISFNAAAIQKAGGFVQFLNQVKTATNGSSTSIARLFGDVNAINTVIAIAKGNFEDFSKTVDNNTKSIGATALAAKELKDSFDFKAGQAEQSIKNLATSFSVFLLPALKTTLEGFKALTGIGRVNVELDENRKQLKNLAIEYNNIKDAISIYQKGLGATAQETLFATKLIKSQADGEKRLNEIIQERINIRQNQNKVESQTTTKSVTPIVDAAAEAESLRLRRETFAQLSLARSEFDAFETQRKFEASLLAGEANQVEFAQLLQNEQAKIDAKYAKEVELTQLIADEKAKRDAQEAISVKKELDVTKFKNNELSKLKIAEAEETKRILTIRNNYIQAAANIGAALFKDGSKEAFAIQKAAALAGVAIDDAKARSSAVAVSSTLLPPFNGIYLAKQNALITSATALSLSGIAAAAIKGFANGGVVGATMGGDNRIATVRDGEMILNAEQQEKLFNMINAGGSGGDIVIQINEREIARAVRSQVQQGYRLA
jgi:TP901 family phage tail tape measure protein